VNAVNRKTVLVIALALMLIGGTVLWSMRPQPVRVAVIVVEHGDVVSTVANTRAGTVDACRRAGLAPAMGDRMAKLPVTEGELVTAGQVLLELWNEDLRAEVMLARRDAVASRGKADEVCVRAQVSEKEATRLTRLQERGLASEEEADRAVGDAQAKAAGCQAARDVAKVSDARITVAEARLERSILRAPFDGVIAEINGELGEFITPSPIGIPTPPTIDLIDSSCLYISAPIDEVDAPAVRAGQKAVITMDAFPDKAFSGVVRRVAPYVLDLEKQARTVNIEAVLDDPEGRNLLPGYSADVEIILATRSDVLRVPTQVILNGDHVFILNNDRIESRAVKIGVTNWDYSEIVSGLTAGEQVVISVDREGVTDGAPAVPE
jgi:HlyD family secretion protein